jgi:hypothetical protein
LIQGGSAAAISLTKGIGEIYTPGGPSPSLNPTSAASLPPGEMSGASMSNDVYVPRSATLEKRQRLSVYSAVGPVEAVEPFPPREYLQLGLDLVFGSGYVLRTLRRENGLWFVAADITPTLSQLLKNSDADEKDLAKIKTPGGERIVLIVKEGVLYDTLIRSAFGEVFLKKFLAFLRAHRVNTTDLLLDFFAG